MIPLYPKFKAISIEDREFIGKYVSAFPPYSDYNFTSLWVWNTEEDILASILNQNLAIRFKDYETRENCYSFLGTNRIEESINTLLNRAEEDGFLPELRLFPETSTGKKKFEGLIISEDMDNFDYIYSTNAIKLLAGKYYAEKRNFVNRFKRLYSSNIRILDLGQEEIQNQIILMIEEWAISRKKTAEETCQEFNAIRRAVRYASKLKLFVVGLYIGDKLIGFTISDFLQNRYVMTLFEKANKEYEGAFAYLRHVTCSELAGLGYNFLNFESDMGIQGLRKSKLSWNPNFFLKKYKVQRSH